MEKAPCKDCKDRTIEPVNCHMNCERYLEFLKELKRKKENYRKLKESQSW